MDCPQSYFRIRLCQVLDFDKKDGAAVKPGMADGANGMIKTIIAVGTGGNAITITPTNLRGYSTISLSGEGETVTCLFKNSKWNVIAHNGATLA